MSEDAQLKIRVPQDLKDYIDEKAKANYRTLNGEVVYRLEQSKWFNKEIIEEMAYEFASTLASALVEDPKVEIHAEVHGFRQPTINGVKQAFQLFLFMGNCDKENFGVEECEDGIRFYNKNDEYIIKNNNPYPSGAYTINHLVKILKKLYFLPRMLPECNNNT